MIEQIKLQSSKFTKKKKWFYFNTQKQHENVMLEIQWNPKNVIAHKGIKRKYLIRKFMNQKHASVKKNVLQFTKKNLGSQFEKW